MEVQVPPPSVEYSNVMGVVPRLASVISDAVHVIAWLLPPTQLSPPLGEVRVLVRILGGVVSVEPKSVHELK